MASTKDTNIFSSKRLQSRMHRRRKESEQVQPFRELLSRAFGKANGPKPGPLSQVSCYAPAEPYTPRQSLQPRMKRNRIFILALEDSKSQSCITFGRSRQYFRT